MPRRSWARLGLHGHLSSQRSNGLRAMVERIRDRAPQAALDLSGRCPPRLTARPPKYFRQR